MTATPDFTTAATVTTIGGAAVNPETANIPKCTLPLCPITGRVMPHVDDFGVETLAVRVIRL